MNTLPRSPAFRKISLGWVSTLGAALTVALGASGSAGAQDPRHGWNDRNGGYRSYGLGGVITGGWSEHYGGVYGDDVWLDRAVAPVALYPDDILAVALQASTYPDDVARARELVRSGNDYGYGSENYGPDSYGSEGYGYGSEGGWEGLNPSVVALINYPQVLDRLDSYGGSLGSAFARDPRAVMEAVQRMRWQAYSDGWLHSDSRQIVRVDEGRIRILSRSDRFVYLPDYNPNVFSSRPLGWSYSYYTSPFPLYYYSDDSWRRSHSVWGGGSAWCIDWWNWDMASGIVIDFVLWHHSDHRHGDDNRWDNDWQHDWSRERGFSALSGATVPYGGGQIGERPWIRNTGGSIRNEPVSAQVRPLEHALVGPRAGAAVPPVEPGAGRLGQGQNSGSPWNPRPSRSPRPSWNPSTPNAPALDPAGQDGRRVDRGVRLDGSNPANVRPANVRPANVRRERWVNPAGLNPSTEPSPRMSSAQEHRIEMRGTQAPFVPARNVDPPAVIRSAPPETIDRRAERGVAPMGRAENRSVEIRAMDNRPAMPIERPHGPNAARAEERAAAQAALKAERAKQREDATDEQHR